MSASNSGDPMDQEEVTKCCIETTNSMIEESRRLAWIEYLRGGGYRLLYFPACVLVAGRSELPLLE